jgi:hypothetical protein
MAPGRTWRIGLGAWWTCLTGMAHYLWPHLWMMRLAGECGDTASGSGRRDRFDGPGSCGTQIKLSLYIGTSF